MPEGLSVPSLAPADGWCFSLMLLLARPAAGLAKRKPVVSARHLEALSLTPGVHAHLSPCSYKLTMPSCSAAALEVRSLKSVLLAEVRWSGRAYIPQKALRGPAPHLFNFFLFFCHTMWHAGRSSFPNQGPNFPRPLQWKHERLNHWTTSGRPLLTF